ncbi:lipocalin family protein [Bacteroidia bacterium]|nr:lipocalin family protein [Bacteroidia bacterium]MDB4107088.1 lipocalin family protein [Bacteroidia bacterium]MDB9882608.1 lipocalin family protein [Bacteroidia bacterium]
MKVFTWMISLIGYIRLTKKTINYEHKTLLFVLLASFVAFQGCKDDEGSTVPSVSEKTQLITASPWVLSAITIKIGTEVEDMYSDLDACSKDDEIIFKSDGTEIFDEGDTKCDPDADQQETFTWSFNTAETELTLTEDGEPETGTLKELSATKMELEFSQVEDGVTYMYNSTYTH